MTTGPAASTLDERARHSLALTFWGVDVVVRVPSLADRDYLGHHFADHLADRVDTGEPIRVWMTYTGPFDAFVDALRHDGGVKSLHVDLGAGPELWEEWATSPSRPSPLPPFTLPPLAGRVRLLHASAAALPGDGSRAVTIGGASLAGKTSVLLGLLERGWRFCSDDTTPVVDGRIARYTRPLNVRAQSLGSFPLLADRIRAAGRCVLTRTGPTFMVRPRDLDLPRSDDFCTRVLSVRLEASADWHATQDGRSLVVGHDVERDLSRTLDRVEAAVSSIEP
jgi:hypothetical protein